MTLARAEMMERLRRPLDVLVIGGGITGAGVARDAARRGLRVGLVEKCDLAYGTSSRSSKLIHGGLRYLEHFQFGLVFESVSERHALLSRIAPHLVRPAAFLFPIYRESKVSLLQMRAGMWLYDGLALFRSPEVHRTLRPSEVYAAEPAVKRDGMRGAPLYYDCATDDARLTLENALDAANHGAAIATWTEVERISHDAHGRVCGAMVHDHLTGARTHVQAHAVINATGPWTDRVLGRGHDDSLLRTTKGVHIAVASALLPVRHTVVCLHPTDRRILFAVPWGDLTYVGTTDTDYEGSPDDVAATREDVNYLLAAVHAYFPENAITQSQIVSTWAGLRPLLKPLSDVSASATSREHEVITRGDGLITIAGGKLTTFRRMAAEVVDEALVQLKTQHALGDLKPMSTDEPLPGGAGWPTGGAVALVADLRARGNGTISEATSELLVRSYGVLAREVAALCHTSSDLAAPLVPGRPEVLAQVEWAVTREFAARLSDVMTRRTQLYYRDANQGLDAAPGVAAHMAKFLDWDVARREEEIALYRAEVERSRRWRAE